MTLDSDASLRDSSIPYLVSVLLKHVQSVRNQGNMVVTKTILSGFRSDRQGSRHNDYEDLRTGNDCTANGTRLDRLSYIGRGHVAVMYDDLPDLSLIWGVGCSPFYYGRQTILRMHEA